MSKSILAITLLALIATPSSAQQMVELPLGSWAYDVTPDGSVVVGDINGEALDAGQGAVAFRPLLRLNP